jgi:hypothetical protein
MTRKALWMFVLPAALCMTAAGCLESDVELAVQRDGSGVVTETVWLTQAMLEMGGLMGGPGGQQPKGEFHPMVMRMADKAALEKRAAAMGEGVTLRSVKPQKDKDGRQGYVAVYDVKDVNQLKLRMGPASPRSPRRRGDQPKEKKDQVLIRYKPGSNKVTIVMPKREIPAGEAAKPPPKPVGEEQKQMYEMMKQMFAGMKVAVRVKVPGTITKTNASLVNPKKDGVTLMEMNIGALLLDEKLAKKLEQIGRIKDVQEAREKLNDPEMKKYVKFETAPKVEIEFK